MSGFGTQKMPTTALNLGFPSAYQEAVKGRAVSFAPMPQTRGEQILVGDDMWAQYHAQKRRDANYMANAKVVATANMNNRANVSHAGYWEMPKPVLGQRKFANPSNGYGGGYESARRDQEAYHAPWTLVGGGSHSGSGVYGAGEHLEGGVLRSPVGMAYGKQKLMDRIKQLNAITEAKNNFYMDGQTGMPTFNSAQATESEQLSLSPQLELAQLLESIQATLMEPGEDLQQISRFTFQDTAKAFNLIVRLATNNSASEITDILEYIQGGSGVDGINQLIANLLTTYNNPDILDENARSHWLYIQRLSQYFTRMEEYLKKMLKVADQPKREREATSKALVKSLKFINVNRDAESMRTQVGNETRETLARLPARGVGMESRAPQRSGAFIAPHGDEETPDVPRPYGTMGVVRDRRRGERPDTASGASTPYLPSSSGRSRASSATAEELLPSGWADRFREARSRPGAGEGIGIHSFFTRAGRSGEWGRVGYAGRGTFTAPSARREDTEHGYTGRLATFDVGTRDAFGAGFGATGDQTRTDVFGRLPAYVGEDEEDEDDAEALAARAGGEDEADLGGDFGEEDDDEEEDSSGRSEGAPGMRSVAKSAITGEADIETGRSAPKPSAGKPSKGEIAVPDWRNGEALRSWVRENSGKIEGFTHKPQAGSTPKMLRRAVVQKLKALGYKTTWG